MGLIVCIACALLHAVEGAAQEQPSRDPQVGAWRTTLLYSDFELGDLEDATLDGVRDPAYLAHWRQRYDNQRLPRFMQVSLARGGVAGERYLKVPLDSADMVLETREELTLPSDSWLICSLMGRWSSLGDGEWRVELFTDNERHLLLRGSGVQEEWKRFEQSIVVPPGLQKGRLRLVVVGQRGKIGGSLGFDNFRCETEPQLAWRFKGRLRRVEPREEEPLTVSSRGLPGGSYKLRTRVIDADGQVQLQEERDRLVNDDLPLQYTPRFRWNDPAAVRGIYTVEVQLTHQESGRQFRDSRKFVAAADPRFPRQYGGIRWGAEVTETGEPSWLSIVAPDRVAFVLDNRRPQIPQWLIDRRSIHGTAIVVSLDGQLQPQDLSALVVGIRRVHWRSRDRATGAEFLQKLKQEYEFLEVGFRLPEGERDGPFGEIILTPRSADTEELWNTYVEEGAWGARLPTVTSPSGVADEVRERDAAEGLAKSLYLLAAHAPSVLCVVFPDELFINREGRHRVPRSTLLVWEFLTGFLSGARFVARENWDSDGTVLVWQRDDAEYLVVFGDVPHPLTLAGGAGRSYDIFGGTQAVTSDSNGIATLSVDRMPRLIEGFDIDRIRTHRSLTARITEGKGTEQQIAVSIQNFFEQPVRAELTVQLPRRWEYLTPSEPKFLEGGERGEIVLGVAVPRALGIDGAAKLAGELLLTTSAGESTRVPVELDVPIDSPWVEIRPVNMGRTEAEVRVKNISDQRLQLRVNLLVSPDGPELTRHSQNLEPGEERSYQIAYPAAAGKRSMWVGVAVERPESYVNRTYEIPAGS